MASRAGSRLTFRSARSADLPRLLHIHTAAFPDPRREPERRTNFTHNVRGKLENLIIALRGDEIIAHAFLFESRGFFGGFEVRVGAIASVGVAQESRGIGVGRALVEELHARALARGDAVTLLFPFRSGFYAAMDYGAVSHYRRLSVAPASIPRAWVKSLEKSGLRAMRPEDRPAVEALFAEVARRRTGQLSRTTAFWDRLLADERRSLFVVASGEKIAGYVCWSLDQDEAHAKATLTVHEVTTRDDATKRLFFGLIGAQAGQATEAIIELDATDPIDRAFIDPDAGAHGTLVLEHPFGHVANGPMVRVLHPKRAIEARGYAADGDVVLKIEGSGAVELAVRQGRAKMRSTGKKPDISLDRAGLASLLYGGISPSAGAAIGRYRVRGDMSRMDDIFSMAPFFALDPF